ncbi:baculoviral IAP repeat-containing protein 7-B-like [Penaeus japonicus]|uniref:baculoviral IAP repeat-containing protein 7-B-like n=1 Tax=Penaeus japonicus TaxID=27405 RepID=UPI001C711319|nr:baculoviral IAP repeat-containing protein 7-B-like [Penaeus japonicus]XP_042855274.1 baculoviral IAP repeat-containing protein 7-B-like [Penaeus japonicus]
MDSSDGDTVDYRIEQERLDTFKNWPLSWLSPEELAADGFYYLGKKDQTMCAFCRGIIMKWESEDTPRGEHTSYYPNCPFINNKQVGNVPLVHGGVNKNCASSPEAVTNTSVSEKDYEKENELDSPNANTCLVPTVIEDSDDRQDLRNEKFRLETFKGWPVSWLPPADLAADGFVYLGKRDYCRCVFCRQIVGEWVTGDTPRGEHKKFNAQCPFILGKPVGNIPI